MASPPSSAFFATSICNSASSAAVSRSLSFHCVGRVIGVTLLLDQTTCRSGRPSEVLGTLYDGSTPNMAPAGSLADCAVSDAAAKTTAEIRAPNILTRHLQESTGEHSTSQPQVSPTSPNKR